MMIKKRKNKKVFSSRPLVRLTKDSNLQEDFYQKDSKALVALLLKEYQKNKKKRSAILPKKT